MLISGAHVAMGSVHVNVYGHRRAGPGPHQQLYSGACGIMSMGKLACSPLLMASGRGGAGEERLTFPLGASHEEFDHAPVSTGSTQ